MGFVYAYVGYAGVENPGLALALSALLPAVIWMFIRSVYKFKRRQD
jgi:hypothetical protein